MGRDLFTVFGGGNRERCGSTISLHCTNTCSATEPGLLGNVVVIESPSLRVSESRREGQRARVGLPAAAALKRC